MHKTDPPRKSGDRRPFRPTSAAFVCALLIGPAWPDGPRWVAPGSESEKVNPVKPTAESLARGGALYREHCVACHGTRGDGRGPVARRLGFSAGDLTDAESMGRQTDGALFWKIASGRDPMPSFSKDRGLDEARIWDLVNFTRSLASVEAP